MSRALLSVSLQQWNRAPSPIKHSWKRCLNSARQGQRASAADVPVGADPAGAAGLGAGSTTARHQAPRAEGWCFQGSCRKRALHSGGVCVLSFPCHKKDHFLQRKGTTRQTPMRGGGASPEDAGGGEE